MYKKVTAGKVKKNEKLQFFFLFFFNASIEKMVPKGLCNEKNIQSMLARLETAKIWWKMPFLRHFYAIFLDFDVLWQFEYEMGIAIIYWTFDFKIWKKTCKSWLDCPPLTRKWVSHTPHFSCFASKISRNANFDKKMMAKVGLLILVH